VSSAEWEAMDNLPTAVLYDMFRDAATALSVAYVARSDQATTTAESTQWWDRVLALRDTADATDPDDRRALSANTHTGLRMGGDVAAADA
jgi:hypothetical protein